MMKDIRNKLVYVENVILCQFLACITRYVDLSSKIKRKFYFMPLSTIDSYKNCFWRLLLLRLKDC